MSAVLKDQTEPAAFDEAQYLNALGERVRNLRAQRGMTRKILARDSGVSERYLALLEAGEGNVSVVLLKRIAQALNVPSIELLREQGSVSAEHAEVQTLLRRLSPAQMRRAAELLEREFHTDVQARSQRIALVGLRGAGKSSIGSLLAKELKVPFVELDREVEREANTSLNEIFLLYGQAGYRRYERAALDCIIAKHERVVIATGGSIVSEPETYEHLLASCFTVWLKAAPEEHMARVVAQGDTRPMKGNREAMEDLRRILGTRSALYGRADCTIDTSGRAIEKSLADLTENVAALSAA
ncbi:MAG TPA: helix-turn-helix transcriptional regulator [Burkholderiales bacterium]